jgi:major intracellular serine protease
MQQLRERLDWGVSTFELPEAWKVTKGEGITIAVLDTGCDLDHPDLKDNLLEGYNFVEPDEPPEDDGEHGTHVTGILCAQQNELGTVGVAPKAKVRPVKVLDGYGDGEIENVVKAIRWSIKQKVDFISMSLGTMKPMRSLRWALKAADKANIPVFVAAGNIGKSEHLLYPANYPETIAIGAIDKKLRRADFTNTGKNLDFMAPGVDILSTVPNNWWAILSGSSMAQPFVCGLAALLLSYKRNVGLDIEINNADSYRQFFREHTINVVGEEYAGDPFYQGFGIITLGKLLKRLSPRQSSSSD